MKAFLAILAVCASAAQAGSIVNTNSASSGGVVNNQNVVGGGAYIGSAALSHGYLPYHSKGQISNSNAASFGGMVNNGNTLHREARAISNSNIASNGGVVNNQNVVGGGAHIGSAAMSHGYLPHYSTGRIVNSNTASFGGIVNNVNTVHREARAIISNSNVASNGGVINNNNIIGVGGCASGFVGSAASSHHGCHPHYVAGRISNSNVASFGGLVKNGNTVHREARAISNSNVASNGGLIDNKNLIAGGTSSFPAASSAYPMSGSSSLQHRPQRPAHGVIDNTNQASSNGQVNNENIIRHRQTRSIRNENVVLGSGKISNSNKDDMGSVENTDVFVTAAPTTEEAPVTSAL